MSREQLAVDTAILATARETGTCACCGFPTVEPFCSDGCQDAWERVSERIEVEA